MVGRHEALWYLAALPPTQTMCLIGAGALISKSPKSLLPPQNNWAYFLSPSQNMLIPTPCTPSDLLCQHERWGQHGRGLTEKLGYLLRGQAIATVYSCFPSIKW